VGAVESVSRAQDSRGTRDGILTYAVQLASLEGLESLTIGRLAEALRMSKSGLFSHFGSKQGLQLAVLERAADVFAERVRKIGRRFPAGLERLLALLEAWLAYVEERDFEGGCFFAAASAEFDGRPGPVRDALVRLARAWVTALEAEIRKATERAELDSDTEISQLVFELHAIVQGANWSFQLLEDPACIGQARTAIQRRLNRATTSKGRELCSRLAATLKDDVRTARLAAAPSSDSATSFAGQG
jgi:AcrR family transcriptional regulator